jgi:two-component system, LytTR family, sensor kinase
MPIRWKQYELFFAIAIFLLLLANNTPFGGTKVQIMLFRQHEVEYSFFFHTLIPFLLTHVLPLVLLIAINIWLLPQYLHTQKQFIALPVAAVMCWLLLCMAFTIAFFYKGFYLTATLPSEDIWQRLGQRALGKASLMIVTYLLYCSVRELIIQWVNQEHPKRPFRIMLCNKIMATAFIYTGVLFAGFISRVFSDGVGIIYVFILLPVIIIIFINVYGLFPYRDKMQIPLHKYWFILLIAPVLLSIFSTIILDIMSSSRSWLQLAILTLMTLLLAIPVSWLVYSQQKNKLGVLLQLQKDLGNTTADLAFLRSQINPHFLFNTLNTLYGTALQENAGRTAEGVQRLGDMMRFMLHENHRRQIPLKRELEYLNNYISLQQLRIATSKDISIETDIYTCSYEHLIAPMLLVPFVENAYKHGIRLTAPSFIKINFYCDEKGIYLDVVNSLHPKKIQEGMPHHSGVGLQNVKDRLQLAYADKYTLQIQEDDTAFTVHLHIQLKD